MARGVLLAAWVAVGGTAANGVVAATGVIAAAGEGAQLGDLINAGGSFSAAGALIYIVKKMTDGQLVARDAAAVEAQQAEQIKRHQDLLAESLGREQKLEALYAAAIARNQEQK